MVERASQAFLRATETSNSPRRVILEIGPGGTPICTLSGNILKQNDLYIGLDDARMGQGFGKQKTGGEVFGELENLPIKGGSVDEIWALNVFGWIYYSLPAKNNASFIPRSMRNFLKEMRKTLKPEGTIYIGEYYTPPSFLRLANTESLGFEKQVFTGPDIDNFIQAHELTTLKLIWGGCLLETPTHQPFFLTLTKKP